MAGKPEQQKCGEPRSEVNAVAARSGGNRLINIGKVCPVGRDALRRCFSGLWLFLERESFGGSVGKHRVASVLNYQLVRNKCNKFSVGGLIVFSVYVKSEEFVDVFDFAACPAYLNCVTYCAFDFARGRVEPLCNAGVKLLGDFADKLGFIIDHANCFAEKMVSLNMSGNADGEENGGDFFIKAFDCGRRCKTDVALVDTGFKQIAHPAIQEFGFHRLKHDIAGTFGE